MSQRTLVKEETNRYGIFRTHRYEELQEFDDELIRMLKRPANKIPKKSKTVIEWEPQPGKIFKISNGTYGEMLARSSKPLEQLINEHFHKTLLAATK